MPDFEYDVFLSHSSADKPAVREQQVTPETLRAFYDKFGEELFSQEAAIRVMHLMRSAAKDAPDAEPTTR